MDFLSRTVGLGQDGIFTWMIRTGIRWTFDMDSGDLGLDGIWTLRTGTRWNLDIDS